MPVVEFGDLSLLIHLMSAGRLRVFDKRASPKDRASRVLVRLEDGRELRLREFGTKQRAWAKLLPGTRSPRTRWSRRWAEAWPPPPLDVFAAAIAKPRHLHPLLRHQKDIARIGRSWVDEILWEARLSPFKKGTELDEAEVARLHAPSTSSVTRSTATSRRSAPTSPTKSRSPSIHKHEGEPCPRCGTTLEAVFFSEHQMNYCPNDQTGGRVLKDRRLSETPEVALEDVCRPKGGLGGRLIQRNVPRRCDPVSGPEKLVFFDPQQSAGSKRHHQDQDSEGDPTVKRPAKKEFRRFLRIAPLRLPGGGHLDRVDSPWIVRRWTRQRSGSRMNRSGCSWRPPWPRWRIDQARPRRTVTKDGPARRSRPGGNAGDIPRRAVKRAEDRIGIGPGECQYGARETGDLPASAAQRLDALPQVAKEASDLQVPGDRFGVRAAGVAAGFAGPRR